MIPTEQEDKAETVTTVELVRPVLTSSITQIEEFTLRKMYELMAPRGGAYNLAPKLGVTPSYLSNFKTGKQNRPGIDLIESMGRNVYGLSFPMYCALAVAPHLSGVNNNRDAALGLAHLLGVSENALKRVADPKAGGHRGTTTTRQWLEFIFAKDK